MSAIGLCLQAALRARRASAIALVLLVVVAGGAVLGATAGARRTASAYPRMVTASNAYDVLVNPAVTADFDAIEAEPQVVDAVRGYGQFVALERHGAPDFSVSYVPMASDGRIGYEVNRPVNLDGRLPGKDRPDEIALSRPLARRLHRAVGDHLALLAFAGGGDTAERVDARVVGVGLFPNDALQEEDDPLTSPFLFLSPAFRSRYGEGPSTFVVSLVALRSPRDIGAFSVEAERHAEGQLFLQSQAESTAKAQRALRPYSAALAAFAIAAGVAAVFVVGQALTRQLLADAPSAPTLSALGMLPRQQVAVSVLHAGLIGTAGAAGAAAVAVVLSPLLPVGPARALDPDPGLHADLAVLAAGAAVIITLCVLWGAVVGRRVARSAAAAPASAPATRVRLAEGVARIGLPAPAATGLRMAVEPGEGRGAVPVRTTLVGAALGLAALTTAVTFGSGLHHLLATPRLYGWDWDAAVVAGTGEGLSDALVERVRGSEAVAAASEGGYGQVDVGGLSVAAIGMGDDGGPAVHPTVLEGRAALATDEIVLGSATLDRIDRHVGDAADVTVGGTSVRARIVGRAVFPKFAAYPGSDRTGLGVGAALTMEGLHRLIPDATTGFLAVRFRPGAEPSAALAELDDALGPPPSDVALDAPHVETGARPDDLVGYDRVGTTPLVLAALLAVLAVGTTAHGLLAAVRSRRREFGLLKAIGFTPRQVSSAVAWHATTVALVSAAIGVPLGIAAGRRLWAVLADRLGAVAQPVTPTLAAVLAVPVAIVLLNLVAAIPAWQAGSGSPADALRTE